MFKAVGREIDFIFFLVSVRRETLCFSYSSFTFWASSSLSNWHFFPPENFFKIGSTSAYIFGKFGGAAS